MLYHISYILIATHNTLHPTKLKEPLEHLVLHALSFAPTPLVINSRDCKFGLVGKERGHFSVLFPRSNNITSRTNQIKSNKSWCSSVVMDVVKHSRKLKLMHTQQNAANAMLLVGKYSIVFAVYSSVLILPSHICAACCCASYMLHPII